MGIYFGSSDAFVAKHLLDGTEISTILQEMGGKGMPKSVRTDSLFNTCFFGKAFYDGKNHGSGKGAASSV